MRNCLLFIIPIVLVLLISGGCSLLMPKNKEFFQDKVKEVPKKTTDQALVEKQAAKYIAERAHEAEVEALRAGAPTNIVNPIQDVSMVSYSLSTSLGPPPQPWTGSALALSRRLDLLEARLDSKINKFAAQNDQNIGKKIEGTGLFQVNYFVFIGGIIFIGWLLLLGLKIYGMVNPVVGAGMSVAKVPVKVLAKGFSQIISGGEKFKADIEKKIEDPELRDKILEIFRINHERAQNEEVQDIVKTLSSKK